MLAVFLGWAIYKWKQSAKETDEKRYVVYNTGEKSEPLASQVNFQSDSELWSKIIA